MMHVRSRCRSLSPPVPTCDAMSQCQGTRSKFPTADPGPRRVCQSTSKRWVLSTSPHVQGVKLDQRIFAREERPSRRGDCTPR
jgi:hypothetical protein